VSPGVVHGFPLTAGSAHGSALRLERPLSFWGGTNHEGLIVDQHHPQFGVHLVGRVVLMTSGRGSSSSSSVLAEQIRAGTAPAAIVLAHADAIIAVAAIVAFELYGLAVPIVLVDAEQHRTLPDDVLLTVQATDEQASIRWP
jgi:predicted aconitase with swiveling domain